MTVSFMCQFGLVTVSLLSTYLGIVQRYYVDSINIYNWLCVQITLDNLGEPDQLKGLKSL